MKKKLEVSIKCNDSETFNKYFMPEYNKIVGMYKNPLLKLIK